MNNTLTALKGVRVGHSTHLDKLTGCTVVVFEKDYPVTYKSYGGSPGTYATENLNNRMSFASRDALFIAGGSLNGLTAAATITQKLIDNGIGFRAGKVIMPAISGAIVWDLGMEVGQFDRRYGEEAVESLSSEPVQNGNVGAGTGTSVGKFQYLEKGMKSGGMKAGVGSSRVELGNGAMVCALSVVNALGNIINHDGSILAGNRDENKKFKTFEDTINFVTQTATNTTISIVGTNIDLLTRENYEIVAHLANHGQVRAINPVNTSIDGDTVFVFSTQEIKTFLNDKGKFFKTENWPLFDVDLVGQAAAKAVQESIYDACISAETIEFEGAYKGIIPSVKDYQ